MAGRREGRGQLRAELRGRRRAQRAAWRQGLGDLSDRDSRRHPAGEDARPCHRVGLRLRSEEHTSELQSLMRISYAVFCLKKKKNRQNKKETIITSRISNKREKT